MTARDRALRLRATARRVVRDAEEAGRRPLGADALLAMADRAVAGLSEAGSNRARPGDLDYGAKGHVDARRQPPSRRDAGR